MPRAISKRFPASAIRTPSSREGNLLIKNCAAGDVVTRTIAASTAAILEPVPPCPARQANVLHPFETATLSDEMFDTNFVSATNNSFRGQRAIEGRRCRRGWSDENTFHGAFFGGLTSLTTDGGELIIPSGVPPLATAGRSWSWSKSSQPVKTPSKRASLPASSEEQHNATVIYRFYCSVSFISCCRLSSPLVKVSKWRGVRTPASQVWGRMLSKYDLFSGLFDDTLRCFSTFDE